MSRDLERCAPLGQRMMRIWFANPNRTFLALLLDAVNPQEDPTSIEDLELVTRLERRYKDA